MVRNEWLFTHAASIHKIGTSYLKSYLFYKSLHEDIILMVDLSSRS